MIVSLASIGIGDGGYEDEEREVIQSRKAKLEQKLRGLSQRPEIYEYLARSLAPSIWEMEDVKKGILLRLFGGSNKSVARGGGVGGPPSRYRGDINMLLPSQVVGDPGFSNSQLLQVIILYSTIRSLSLIMYYPLC